MVPAAAALGQALATTHLDICFQPPGESLLPDQVPSPHLNPSDSFPPGSGSCPRPGEQLTCSPGELASACLSSRPCHHTQQGEEHLESCRELRCLPDAAENLPASVPPHFPRAPGCKGWNSWSCWAPGIQGCWPETAGEVRPAEVTPSPPPETSEVIQPGALLPGSWRPVGVPLGRQSCPILRAC